MTNAASAHDSPSSPGGGAAVPAAPTTWDVPNGTVQCQGPPKTAGTKVSSSRCEANVTVPLAVGTFTWFCDLLRVRA